jgi:hypothetical protein
MKILEPMTTATDLVLALAAAWFAARLWRMPVSRAWPLAFVFTALGSLAGGAYHAAGGIALWKVTVYAVGLASFFLLVANRVPPIIALAKFILYASWMITHDDYLYVIADYGTTLVIVAVVQSVAWFRSRAASASWIVSSVGMSVLAAIVQQSGIDLHPHFNHNDLYHVMQLVALWLLCRGGESSRA